MDNIITYQENYLISSIYNNVWRWLYTTRKNIIRSIRMKIMRKNNSPKLTRHDN